MSDSPAKPTRTLEIAHVLFTDIVGYSKLPMDEQEQLLMRLQEAVRQTSEFVRAEAVDELIRLPTGDGMALVFFRDAEAPTHCAMELSRILRDYPSLQLRMGIHSGPVCRVADINANRNVAGGGINLAQRVMDSGDAGHILVSREVAEVLGQLSGWRPMLHDLGEVEVKHGVRLHLYNLYSNEVGNAVLPKKVAASKPATAGPGLEPVQKSIHWQSVTGATVVVIGLAVGGWLLATRKTHALNATDTIVLADFANSTGEPVFDDTLKQALATGLQQSPFLNILSDRRVYETLKLMGRAADDRLDEKTAMDVCRRAECKAIVSGSIASLGNQYVIGLKALNCQTGESLASEEVQATKKEGVLHAIDKGTKDLRKRLGESLSTVQKYDTPLEQATTPSLEALKAFSLAVKATRDNGDNESIPLYERAIELDPNFALAYANLGTGYFNLGEPNRARQFLTKAYQLRERTSEWEQLAISASYFQLATGQLEKANQAYETWAKEYPRSFAPVSSLGVNYGLLGQNEKALASDLEAQRRAPDNGNPYNNLITDYTSLGRLNEAEATYRQATERKLEYPWLHQARYLIAFFEEDAAEMDRQVAWATAKPGIEDVLFFMQANTEAFFGRLEKAKKFLHKAVDSAWRNDEREPAAGFQISMAMIEADFGISRQLRVDISAALELAPTRDVRVQAALALARAGDPVRSKKLADDLAKDNPLDTLINGLWLPSVRAAIELDKNNPAKTIELLQTVSPYEMSAEGNLYPVYIRGLAYLLLRKGNEAAIEFQKLLEHRGVVQNNPWGALASLGLARAYVLQGDTTKARAAYENFLGLWKDADPDIPILIAAKSEYAQVK